MTHGNDRRPLSGCPRHSRHRYDRPRVPSVSQTTPPPLVDQARAEEPVTQRGLWSVAAAGGFLAAVGLLITGVFVLAASMFTLACASFVFAVR